MKIVVVGSQGTLGSELVRSWNDPYVEARIAERSGRPAVDAADEIVPLNLPDFDMCSRGLAIETVCSFSPDVIVNAAGVNLIDWLETRPNTARNLHEHGPANLREAAKRSGALFVQFGCGEIFYRSKLESGAEERGRERAETPEAARAKVKSFSDDAEQELPVDPGADGFDEFTVPNPASVYAKTKLESERVASEAPERLVLRFSSLFGETTPFSSGNLISSLLNAFRRTEKVSVLSDVMTEPIWALDVLCALKVMIRSGARGIFHLTGGSRGTPAEVGEYLLKATGLRRREVVGITSADYGMQAPHSVFPILSSSRMGELDAPYAIPDWRQGLTDFLDRRQSRTNF